MLWRNWFDSWLAAMVRDHGPIKVEAGSVTITAEFADGSQALWIAPEHWGPGGPGCRVLRIGPDPEPKAPAPTERSAPSGTPPRLSPPNADGYGLQPSNGSTHDE